MTLVPGPILEHLKDSARALDSVAGALPPAGRHFHPESRLIITEAYTEAAAILADATERACKPMAVMDMEEMAL